MKTLICLCGLLIMKPAVDAAVVVIPVGTYTENFNQLATGLPNGWSVYYHAGANSLGTAQSLTTAATIWGTNSPNFRNSASTTGLNSGSSGTSQNNSTNRALSASIGGVTNNGNPGASMNFNFSTGDVILEELSFDLLMLRPGNTEGVWSIQLGVGATPTVWSTLDTYSSSVWGSTTLTYSADDFGTAFNGQEEVWFRVIMTGSGGGTPYENVGIDNFSITAVAVPEPGMTSALLLLAGGYAGWKMRRRERL